MSNRCTSYIGRKYREPQLGRYARVTADVLRSGLNGAPDSGVLLCVARARGITVAALELVGGFRCAGS